MAQNHMKQQVDQHRSKHSFEVGDLVFLWLQPYNHTSLKAQGHQNLSHKFYGPYHNLPCIGPMAYKLSLPASSKIHPVFHVSCLNKVVGPNCHVQSTLPVLDEEGPFGFNQQPSYKPRSNSYVSGLSRKFWSNGKILH